MRYLPRPTYANVMATAAMFVALGGTSYAVTKLPKKSVGTEQLRDQAVTSAKLAPGVAVSGPAGARGPRGEQGPAGATGATGQQGPAGGVAQAEPWQSLGLIGNWTNFEESFSIAGFRKDASGTVQLRGVVKRTGGPVSAAIATLPPGYRPAANEVFSVSTGDASTNVHGRVDVLTTGDVYWRSGASDAARNYTSLGGIFFTPAG